MTSRRTTQLELIREALLSGRSLTPLEALQEFGCFRLAAAIHTLRQEGLDIVTDMVPQPGALADRGRENDFARYSLRPPAGPQLRLPLLEAARG